ncbi:MAG: cation:proton antiporter [Candidatus Eisenbacteria sp.]|nr:cation:proton antiporter [Candidatus Eisenbacteria bacterium]
MQELTYLQDLVVILGFGIVVVAIFHKLKLPSIAGLIVVGTVVGPHSLGIIDDVQQVEVLAEIGAALLLFGIGLELSLKKLRRLWKMILMGGSIQVGLSTVAAFAISRLWGLPPNTALFVGFLVALSSTAIVLRGLQQRSEVDAPHGRLILGILVFQDFAVVPMMLLIPFLSGQGGFTQNVFGAMLSSLAVVVGVLLAAYLIVPRLLKCIAKTRQRHLFILTIFVICSGTAWLITTSGATLAIGAFLAGLVVAGTEYRHQALADLISFREVFASLFFVSVGMLLAPVMLVENLVPILVLLVAILLGKSLIVFVTALIVRMPLRVCLLSAVALAQVGEFSLVLSFAAKGSGLVGEPLESNLLTAAVLSMFLAPFALAFGPRLAAGAGRLRVLNRMLEVGPAENAPDRMARIKDHVIIGGYGFAGLELARSLDECDIPNVVVDINIANVRMATQKGARAFFGDVTSYEVLMQMGAARAKELILVINDPSAAERAVRIARSLAPDLHIIVRTYYLLDIEPLLAAGANEVITAERESAVEVASRVLKRHQIDSEQISRQCTLVRSHTEDE